VEDATMPVINHLLDLELRLEQLASGRRLPPAGAC
jgi:hypothetical protein